MKILIASCDSESSRIVAHYFFKKKNITFDLLWCI